MVLNTILELCPCCNQVVELKNKFEVQQCPNCKKNIEPCSLCEVMHCDKCPLK